MPTAGNQPAPRPDSGEREKNREAAKEHERRRAEAEKARGQPSKGYRDRAMIREGDDSRRQ